MIALFVMLAPLVAGLILILVVARFAPNVQRETQSLTGAHADDRPEITSDEFKDLVEEIVGSLGLETVFSSMGTGGVVEMTLRDPKPLTGGRILLYATPVISGPVDSVEVLGFAESVRADMGALKGIYVALAGFSDEAKTAIGSTPAPVDLLDGAALLELVRTQLSPERAAFCAEHRGFGRAPGAA
ncbi:MAG: restriction endonuclease [Deltaproteobacteria bacterium]|nr:restriction endonuclease [Deltaproteobacteria bacterium]